MITSKMLGIGRVFDFVIAGVGIVGDSYVVVAV